MFRNEELSMTYNAKVRIFDRELTTSSQGRTETGYGRTRISLV